MLDPVLPEDLEKALDLLMESDDEWAVNKVIMHILYHYQKDGKEEFSEEDIELAVNEMLVDRAISGAVKSGHVEQLIDEKGDFCFQITDEGKKYIDDIEEKM